MNEATASKARKEYLQQVQNRIKATAERDQESAVAAPGAGQAPDAPPGERASSAAVGRPSAQHPQAVQGTSAGLTLGPAFAKDPELPAPETGSGRSQQAWLEKCAAVETECTVRRGVKYAPPPMSLLFLTPQPQ